MGTCNTNKSCALRRHGKTKTAVRYFIEVWRSARSTTQTGVHLDVGVFLFFILFPFRCILFIFFARTPYVDRVGGRRSESVFVAGRALFRSILRFASPSPPPPTIVSIRRPSRRQWPLLGGVGVTTALPSPTPHPPTERRVPPISLRRLARGRRRQVEKTAGARAHSRTRAQTKIAHKRSHAHSHGRGRTLPHKRTRARTIVRRTPWYTRTHTATMLYITRNLSLP